jgi:hypothetical protein
MMTEFSSLTPSDKLDTITIDVSSESTGSPVFIKEFNNLQYNQGN